MVSLTKLLPHKRDKKGTTASEPPHDAPGGAGETVLASVTTDDNGRTVGLEDPNDPALVDDPAIFASDIPVVAVPPPQGEVSKDLVDSKGKPYIDPRVYGGTSIDQTGPGLGEPLNVIGVFLLVNSSPSPISVLSQLTWKCSSSALQSPRSRRRTS